MFCFIISDFYIFRL